MSATSVIQHVAGEEHQLRLLKFENVGSLAGDPTLTRKFENLGFLAEDPTRTREVGEEH